MDQLKQQKNYELFSIQVDKSIDYTVEKVTINKKECQEFFNQFEDQEEIQVTGLYGDYYEILKKLKQSFDGMGMVDSNIDNGKIFGIKYLNQMIFILVFPENFFLQKPIDEKSIKITLFRILFDLVENIHLCLRKEVFEQWYDGECVPFSDINIFKKQEYFIDSSLKQKVGEKQVNLEIVGKAEFKFDFQYQNRGLQAFYYKIEKINQEKSKKQFEFEYNITINGIVKKFYAKQTFQLEEEIKRLSQICFLDQSQENTLRQQLNSLIAQLKNIQQWEDKKIFKTTQKIQEITINDINFREKLIFKIQYCNFKPLRQSNDVQDSVSSFRLEIQKEITTQQLDFLKKQKFIVFSENVIPTFTISFRTKEDHELYLFFDSQNKRHLIYLKPQMQNEWIKLNMSIQKTNEKCVFYFNERNNELYVFNADNFKSIFKIEFKDKEIVNHQLFCCQIDNLEVEQVAQLSQTIQVLIFSNKKQLFVLGEKEKKIQIQNLYNGQQVMTQQHYIQLLSCPSGKHFYFSDQQKCDMFDCNFTLIKSIQIKGQLKVISDNCDVFILNYPNNQLHVLTNIIDKSSLAKVQNEENQIQGNPSIDIIKGASIKFGPISSFLSNQMNNKVYFQIDDQEQSKKVKNYLTRISLYEFDVEHSSGIRYNKDTLSQLRGRFYSRIPLQLCTIESSNLVPLVNGFRKQLTKKQKISIEEKTKEIHLGHIEDYFKGLKDKIFVICIMGKQSSGKSYLVNRIFGTRYSVAACRCTDGVWASFARIENLNYLILDCEGLFSSARSQREEVQMLAFLTALSDVTLLNQDLNFNRFLTDLLDKLSEASEQLVGDTLFKGTLTIVLRDVSANDNKGIDEELINNINKAKSQEKQEVVFLKKLFNNKFSVQKLLNYENRKFDDQIQQFRNDIIKLSKQTQRWQNGEQLIQQIKILLCQLETSDITDSTLLQQQMQIREIIAEKKQEWSKFILSMNNDFKILILNKDENFQENDFISFNDAEMRKKLNFLFREMISKSLGLVNKTENHNKNLEKIDKELQKILLEKYEVIQCNLDSQLKELNSGIEIQKFIIQERSGLNDFLLKLISQLKFCKNKCSICLLNCQNFLIHDSEWKSQLTELREKINNKEEYLRNHDTTTVNDLELPKIKGYYEQLEEQIYIQISKLKYFEQQKQLSIEEENNLKIQKEMDEFFQTYLEPIREFLSNRMNQQVLQSDEMNLIQLEEVKFEKLKELKNDILLQRINVEMEQDQLMEKLEINNQKLRNQANSNRKTQKELENLSVEKNNLQTLVKNLQGQIEQQQLKFSQISNEEKNFVQSQDNYQQLKNIDILCHAQEEIKLQIQEKKVELEVWRKQSEEFLNAKLEPEKFIDIFQQKSQCLEKIETQSKQFEFQKSEINSQIKKLPKNKKNPNELNKLSSQIEQLDKQIKALDEQYENDRTPQIEIIQELIQQEGLKKQQIVEKFLEKNNELETENMDRIIELKDRQLELQIQIDQFHRNQKLNEVRKILEQITLEFQNTKERLNQIEQSYQSLQLEGVAQVCELQKLKSVESEQKQSAQELQTLLLNIKKTLMKIDSGIEKYPLYIDYVRKFQESKISLKEIQNQLSYQVIEQVQKNDTEINIDDQMTQTQKKIQDLQQQKDILHDKIQSYEKILQSKFEIEEMRKQLQLIEINKEDHSCLRTNHQCDEYCISCPTVQCQSLAGHTGEHLCLKPDHACEVECEVQDCASFCSFIRNHPGQHICKNFHQCDQLCQHCPKKCETDRHQIHNEHFCKEIKCNKKCYLCDSGCMEIHSHSKQKSEAHSCDKKDHSCPEKCQQPGICKLIYIQIDSEWNTELSTFTYTYYRQIDAEKQNCISRIPLGLTSHSEDHICMTETDKQYHSCTNRCPECDAFCTKKYGHSGVHSTHQHRNKEKQLFTIVVGDNEQIIIDQTRIYYIGDTAKPETCQESCQRRGRSHFHLVECKGENNCLQLNKEHQKYSRHSSKKYKGFEQMNFDEVLCCQFWKINNWSHPNTISECEKISKCNHYCALCGENDKKFCDQSAWHTNSIKMSDHKFDCQETHIKNQLKGLQVCFVMDSTLSMKRYLTQSVDVIQRIMKESKKNKINIKGKSIPIEFSIVTYNDHSYPYINDSVVKFIDFNNKNIYNSLNNQRVTTFLESIKADGGGDAPEAVLDGIQKAIELSWNKDISYQKIIYLIADAPPHGNNKESGNVYHNYEDNFPDGCPCGLRQEPIFKVMKDQNIKLTILKLNDFLNMAIAEFQKDYKNLCILDIKNDVSQFVDVMVEDICCFLKQEEITFSMQK